MPEWIRDLALILIALVGYFANRTLQGIDSKLDGVVKDSKDHGERIVRLETKTEHLEEFPQANIRSQK